jgi:hypothetical protein
MTCTTAQHRMEKGETLNLQLVTAYFIPVLPRWAMPLLLWRTCSRVTNTPNFLTFKPCSNGCHDLELSAAQHDLW